MKKRAVCFILALVMCLSLALPVFASEPFTHDDNSISITISHGGSFVRMYRLVLGYDVRLFTAQTGATVTFVFPETDEMILLTARVMDSNEFEEKDRAVFFPAFAAPDTLPTLTLQLDTPARHYIAASFDDGISIIALIDVSGDAVVIEDDIVEDAEDDEDEADDDEEDEDADEEEDEDNNDEDAEDEDEDSPEITVPNLDSASSWARAGITRAVGLELVPESLQSDYTQTTTRAEFAALAVALYEALVGEIEGRETFSDTTDVNVEKLAYLGVITGVGGNRFDPDAELTREQAATLVARLAEAIGQPLPEASPTFADNADISSWAVNGVGQVQAAEIMGGVGNNRFSPQGSYTREQSIVTMLRLFDLME